MDTKTYVEQVLPTQLREMTIVPENIKASELAKAIEGTLNSKIGELEKTRSDLTGLRKALVRTFA